MVRDDPNLLQLSIWRSGKKWQTFAQITSIAFDTNFQNCCCCCLLRTFVELGKLAMLDWNSKIYWSSIIAINIAFHGWYIVYMAHTEYRGLKFHWQDFFFSIIRFHCSCNRRWRWGCNDRKNWHRFSMWFLLFLIRFGNTFPFLGLHTPQRRDGVMHLGSAVVAMVNAVQTSSK